MYLHFVIYKNVSTLYSASRDYVVEAVGRTWSAAFFLARHPGEHVTARVTPGRHVRAGHRSVSVKSSPLATRIHRRARSKREDSSGR